MKRLLLAAGAAMAMCLMCLATAFAQDQYFVAVGKIDEAAMMKQENANVMAGHISYLGKLYDEGHLVMAGPFTDTSGEGLILLKAASLDEAEQLLMGDPTMQAGILKPVFLRPLFAAFNKAENKRFTLEDFASMMKQGGIPMTGDSHLNSPETASSSSNGDSGDMMSMTPGGVSFIQVPTTDAAASGKFYSDVFGWSVQEDHGIAFFTAPGGMMGEFSTESKPAAERTGPLFFVNATSIADTIAKVQAAGGQVYMPEMALPVEEWGHIAIIGDSAGNAVGIWAAH